MLTVTCTLFSMSIKSNAMRVKLIIKVSNNNVLSLPVKRGFNNLNMTYGVKKGLT